MEALDVKSITFDPTISEVATGVWGTGGPGFFRLSCVPSRMTFRDKVQVSVVLLRRVWLNR